MNKKEIFELFDFMTSLNKKVFVDDTIHYEGEADITGFKITHPDTESNGLMSETTKETIAFQSEWILRANRIKAELRADGDLVKEVNLGDLLPNGIPVVIVTGGESLRRICPMFQRRSEMMDWMHLVCQYVEARASSSDPVPYYWESNMLELARYLYENQAEKVADRSIYDKCVL